MKLIKKLTALFVVMFCLVTVFATVVSVNAAELEAYSTGFDSSEGFTASNSYNNTELAYTGPEGSQWATYYGTPSTTGAISSQSMQMRWYTSATANLGYTMMNFDVANVTTVKFTAKNTNSINVTVSHSTDSGSTWSDGELYTLSTTATEYTYTVSETGEYETVRIKFALTLPTTAPTGTSRLIIDNVVLYKNVDESSLVTLNTPVATVANKVVSWEAVENVTNYEVALFASAEATEATYTVETTETSYDFSNFMSVGTWYAKVKAVGDNTAYLSSEYSETVTFENTASEVECTPTEFLAYVDPLQNVNYVVSGTVAAFYDQSYNRVETNSWSTTYNNVSFYLADETSEIIIFRFAEETGKILEVGNKVVVKGLLQNYKNVNQIPAGSTLVSLVANNVRVGVQASTLDTTTNTLSLRLVGALNVDHTIVESLSFTINNGTSEVTYGGEGKVDALFSTLTASVDGELVTTTAADQYCQSLFALTITDVPAGVTLTVTASYTTAEGTTSSVTKTITVASDGTVTIA